VGSRPSGVEVVWVKGDNNIHGNELRIRRQSCSTEWHGALDSGLHNESSSNNKQQFVTTRPGRRRGGSRRRSQTLTTWNGPRPWLMSTTGVQSLPFTATARTPIEAHITSKSSTCSQQACADHCDLEGGHGQDRRVACSGDKQLQCCHRKREHKRAVDNGREVPRQVPYTGGPIGCGACTRILLFSGARAVHSGSPAPNLEENPKWSALDLLRGIPPRACRLNVYGLPGPTVHCQTVLHKFVGYLETQASNLIWKLRCSVTITREQAQGISAKDKTSKDTGSRGD